MRYLVEIDTNTSAGKELLKFIEELNAPVSSVSVRKLPALTDEEMALPGASPTKKQLDEWLALPDGEEIDGDLAFSMLREKLATYSRKKK